MNRRSEQEIMASWKNPDEVVASVCCITFNQERYLPEAIDSFLTQDTDFAFEIIVHDDASTDGTADVIREYASLYPNIIRPILQTENQYSKAGLINPRFVFPVARGRYLAICEGDDYWTDPTKLQKQVDFLEQNPDYVITYTDCQAFNENGPLEEGFGGAREDLSARELQRSTPIATLTTCFRNVIGEIPPELLPARYGDFVIWSLLGHHGRGKYLADIKPAAYRVHGSSLHSSQDEVARARMRLSTLSALHTYYTKLGNRELARFFAIRIFFTRLQTMGFSSVYHTARRASQAYRRLKKKYL